MISSIFVNLPVASLKKSVDFFTGLGFKFNAQFTDETSTCMIVNDAVYLMLIEHEKFSSFIDKPIAPSTSTEAILAFACESADEVRELSEKAFALGARKVNEPQDMGFMFSWGFEDLDGHLWDLFYMNPEHVQ
ncbi:VOC family protein [Rhodoluna sp.]|uniref:VOC family protein n=1 Tax=Rhodoluna sp. TaxID=1969481 RepID=UPI0025D4690F|nr:VOC family protein [Rhodoluna sp.]